jgi:hypothetical protein
MIDNVFAPSWKRANIACTHKIMPYVRYVVSESQAKSYTELGLPVWIVPDSAQGSTSRVRNHIMENAQSEHLLIVDDDVTAIGVYDGTKRNARRMSNDEIADLIVKCRSMVEEADVRFWGLNLNKDTGAYREYTPFSLSAFIGGPWQGHYRNDCRYDEEIPLKEDLDMTLQVLNKYRKALRFNMYHYLCDQHGLPGGCADTRTVAIEQMQAKKLLRKWGSGIVRFDTGANHVKTKKQRTYDINPIIKPPIKGV